MWAGLSPEPGVPTRAWLRGQGQQGTGAHPCPPRALWPAGVHREVQLGAARGKTMSEGFPGVLAQQSVQASAGAGRGARERRGHSAAPWAPGTWAGPGTFMLAPRSLQPRPGRGAAAFSKKNLESYVCEQLWRRPWKPRPRHRSGSPELHSVPRDLLGCTQGPGVSPKHWAPECAGPAKSLARSVCPPRPGPHQCPLLPA